MRCPHCGQDNGSRVARTVNCTDGVNRTRICFGCHKPYLTTEAPDQPAEKRPEK